MAASNGLRLSQRSARYILQQCHGTQNRLPQSCLRTFTTARLVPYHQRHANRSGFENNSKPSVHRQLRNYSQQPIKKNATEEAPNAQAYLNSGAIAGARDLVDVKKVLVIGSGGLAIGQAGEFDYSGELLRSMS
jgi:carbamoyl-phosphate synthase large subunit